MKTTFKDLLIGDKFLIAPDGPSVYTKISEHKASTYTGRTDSFFETPDLEVKFHFDGRMAMTAEHYLQIRSKVVSADTPELRKVYIERKFPRAEFCKDIEKRYRWDVLRATGLKIGNGVGIKGDVDLYAYLDDDQIESALRKMIPRLSFKTV